MWNDGIYAITDLIMLHFCSRNMEALSVKIGLELYASSHQKQSCIFFNIYEFKSENSGKEKRMCMFCYSGWWRIQLGEGKWYM